MTGVTLKVDDQDVLAALGALAEAAEDLAPVLKAIGEDWQASTKRRIEVEEDPNGTRWAALNPLYARDKKGPGILRESGQLFGSIVYEVAGNELEVGTNRPHARVHQFGAKIVPKTAAALVFQMGGETFRRQSVTVPARPFLGISVADREAALDAIADYLDLATGGSLTGTPSP